MPYVLLAPPVAILTVVEGWAGGSLLADLGLCGLAAAWMLGMFTLRPGWQDRPAIMGVFVAGLLAITAVLVVRHPVFGLFTPAAS